MVTSGSLYFHEAVHIDKVISSNVNMIQRSNCYVAAHVKRVVNGDTHSGISFYSYDIIFKIKLLQPGSILISILQ